jgi:hypothetical protein
MPMPSNEIAAADPGALIESVITKGDLARLTPKERTDYYVSVCRSVGLNPLTRPFEYLTLQGKTILYARKDATDQLRKLNGLSVEVVSREVDGDLAMVHVRARDKSGRSDEDFGAVSIAGLRGEARANALLKAITKAKRRVTLSISGLGFLDETEVDDIERRDVTPPTAPVDTAADLDAFAADALVVDEDALRLTAEAAAMKGREMFRAFWGPLSARERDVLRPDLERHQAVAAAADDERARDADPFGLPPIGEAHEPEPVAEAPAVPFAAAVRALQPIAGDGEPNWQGWSEAFVALIERASPADCEKLRLSSLPHYGKCRTEYGEGARAIVEALAAQAKEPA